jgi:hypothetical protein
LQSLRPRHPGERLELELVEWSPAYLRFVFSFQTRSTQIGSVKTVRADYYRSQSASEAEPAPLLIVAPILAGPIDDYLASRYFSEKACQRGISTFFVHQETFILQGDRSAVDLEAALRENIRDNIKALDLFVGLPEVDASRLGSFGLSLGAIKNVLLVAAEERLRANVIAMAGSHLGEILLTSREALVLDYVEARREKDGLSREEVAEEFRERFALDPSAVSGAIDNDRVLLFLATWDNKVPYECGLRLRRELGAPETYFVSLGHYTSIIVAPWAAAVAFDWTLDRLGP